MEPTGKGPVQWPGIRCVARQLGLLHLSHYVWCLRYGPHDAQADSVLMMQGQTVQPPCASWDGCAHGLLCSAP